jgi:hypothetical protein
MTWKATLCLVALLQVSGGMGRAQSDGIGAAQLVDAQGIRKRLGLTTDYEGIRGIESVKIAVLDYGFEGVGNGRPYLPANAVVLEHYDPAFVRRFGLGDPDFRKGFDPQNRHGRIMAQIVWGVTGRHRGGPRFYLLNANGPTMLRRAVRFAVEQKVDVVLFSGSFEGGGNGDGRGFINRIVADALAAGILWINSAGNFGRSVYNGPIRVLADSYLRLRDGSDVASLRFRNHLDENTVTVTLTWNDYRDEEDAGTDKDLDLDVENWSGRRVGSSEKVQISGRAPTGPNESRNPRERVVLANLPASPEVPSDPDYCYRIRVRAKRGEFTASDRLRVLVTATREFYVPPHGQTLREAVEFLDASNMGELYPPADNPLVLTIGDSEPSSSIGPTLDGRVKPDVILANSRADFSDGEVSAGSSNAAAYIAGVVVVLKAAAPTLRPRDLLRLARLGPAVPAATLARRPLPSTAPGFHAWQTPNRTRLAQVLLNR